MERTKQKKYFDVEKVIDAATHTNCVVLKTTEKVFEKGFEVTEHLQTRTENMLKKGFNMSAKGQDVIFKVLEATKDNTTSTILKVTKFIGKN